MDVVRFDIAGVVLFRPKRIDDKRGFLSESFRADLFREATGAEPAFVQENHLFSRRAKTVRGFHFQGPPRAQGKLVRVMQGAILDFALDIRRDSPNYGRLIQVELSAAEGSQLWVPPGLAHGFITLAPDTHVLNKLTDYHHPESEGVIAWDDAQVAAPWPLGEAEPVLSEKDRRGIQLRALVSPF